MCYACPCVLASSRHDDVTPNGSFSRAKKRVYGLYLNSIAHELATDNYKISSQIDALELPLTNIFFGSLKYQSLMPEKSTFCIERLGILNTNEMAKSRKLILNRNLILFSFLTSEFKSIQPIRAQLALSDAN